MFLGSFSHRGRHVVSPTGTFRPNLVASNSPYVCSVGGTARYVAGNLGTSHTLLRAHTHAHTL